MKKYVKAYNEYFYPKSDDKDLHKVAEDIADRLSAFLDATSRIDNLGDYLDEYDLEHLGKSMDALYDFAQMYSYDEEHGRRY